MKESDADTGMRVMYSGRGFGDEWLVKLYGCPARFRGGYFSFMTRDLIVLVTHSIHW